MSATDLVTYVPLIDALKIPLPDRIEDRERLRHDVAFAESYGIVVSEHRRKLLAELEQETARQLIELRKTEDYQHSNADEKKILLAASVSKVNAELEFVTNLEVLIKRRCSLGQTISNSFNLEVQSGFNK